MLSSFHRTKILYYLGWSGLTLTQDSTFYSKIVADRLEAVSLNESIRTIALDLLTKLENLDEKLEKAKCRLSASKVDGIELNDDEIRVLLRERRRISKELSELTSVPYIKKSSNQFSLSV